MRPCSRHRLGLLYAFMLLAGDGALQAHAARNARRRRLQLDVNDGK